MSSSEIAEKILADPGAMNYSNYQITLN